MRRGIIDARLLISRSAAEAVFILGAEPLEVPGQNSLSEIAAGSLAVVLYSAAFQFWVGRRLAPASGIQWPAVIAMIASLLTVSVLLSAQGGLAWLYAGLPIFLSGCLGSVVGAFPAGRLPVAARRAPHAN